MENNERFNKLEEIVSEIFIDTHQINAELKGLREGQANNTTELKSLREGQENSLKVFNSFEEAILGKLTELTDEVKGMRKDVKGL